MSRDLRPVRHTQGVVRRYLVELYLEGFEKLLIFTIRLHKPFGFQEQAQPLTMLIPKKLLNVRNVIKRCFEVI